MALNRKIAYIDLSTGKIEIKPIPLDVRKKFLGGRGLDAYLLYNHTEKGCDPLGPKNTVMVSGGILTATLASATARTHVMAKLRSVMPDTFGVRASPKPNGRSGKIWGMRILKVWSLGRRARIS